ncbi:hypothetical protein GCM10009122_52750 [Fulvivirga kasyanovii]|uniref:Cardiolipin synthase N-terminal domain-containing protein n=1 Tax=Fulvivirga kasyanovii TaxID=396812 RepID=A0ABW9RN23_9BACT|nr:hypothetical protein [Fulvivirga kasyanovii]MTI24330.1 hypothetical protein [Fulvivirga kasyanovii]
MLFVVIISVAYLLFSIYVNAKVNKGYYFSEKRRSAHRWLIWMIPFLGAILIKGHWQPKRNYQAEVMTKNERKNKNGSFYESGIAVDA